MDRPQRLPMAVVTRKIWSLDVYKRFARWSDKDVWHKLHQHFADDPDLEHLILDSTIVRAHPCAAGASQKNGGQAEQALGRSKGGFITSVLIAWAIHSALF